MDLDGFKQINDQFGHPSGDQVLIEVARRLSQQMRHGDLLARLGGDEFAVVARCCDYDDAIAMVRRLKDSIRPDIQLANGAKVRVGISVGTATSSLVCTEATELFDQADKALYLSKLR
ncbi:diguanylate cyclase (GGDEF)-like protein [Undibacterium sp. GrIS 1.2]|uniref:GGDEF domain-containing protein n=1 Tax=Undibacterium sp. GrIS 1.2 TaxID=3143933 RepID=UPI0033908950